MTKYHIQGGKPLSGTITISGAKNAAVAIIPAALLVDGVCRIENIPQISDVTLILQILQELGADVRTINRTTVDIDCSHIRNRQVPYELAAPATIWWALCWAASAGQRSPSPAAVTWAAGPSTSTSRVSSPWGRMWMCATA